MPLFFWFDLFLEARAEILEKILLVFWKKFWRQKDILKLTDLYVFKNSNKNSQRIPSILEGVLEQMAMANL